ncbi:MAG: hypothetical protein KGJ60_12340, partial [Verrucomicrobiota bacterium]|nr:hypothetical protein [Verrucomicrobiota bacterium]
TLTPPPLGCLRPRSSHTTDDRPLTQNRQQIATRRPKKNPNPPKSAKVGLTPMPDIGSAIAHLAEEKPQRMPENGKQQNSIELQLRFNTGAKIDAAFPTRAEAITFLRSFT